MVKKLLPLGNAPVVGYQHHAYLLSIMSGHRDFSAWLACNYIQLQFQFVNRGSLNFYGIPKLYPFLEEIYVRKSLLRPYIPGQTFLIDCIAGGWYAVTFANEFHIPDRNAFQQYHMVHDIMVHGYDLDKRLFYIAGYKRDQTFGSSSVHMEPFVQALEDFADREGDMVKWADGIHLYRLDPSQQYHFDADVCRELIDDYLHARNTAKRWRMYVNNVEGVFGLDVYHELVARVRKTPPKQLDIRNFHILYEHKKVMTTRLEYLYNRQQSERFLDFANSYRQLEKQALILRNTVLKYNLTAGLHLQKSMIDMLTDLQRKEERLLPQIVQHI